MDFSQITDSLFIGTTPESHDYPLLRSLGVRLVINMRLERRPSPQHPDHPLPVIWLPTMDSPLFPIPVRALVKGVRAALDTIHDGGKVYAHCAKGIHRSVAMGAAILIALGHSAEDAMHMIRIHRQTADPNIWYIRRRILLFSKIWNDSKKDRIARLAA